MYALLQQISFLNECIMFESQRKTLHSKRARRQRMPDGWPGKHAAAAEVILFHLIVFEKSPTSLQ